MPDGSVRHDSGLIFAVVHGATEDGRRYSDLLASDASMQAFSAHELARGVPIHDLAQRAARLAREAGEWHQQNRH